MSEVKTHREIWGTEFPVGGEWDAGYTPPRRGVRQGRWTARRTEARWEVVFHPFDGGPEETLATFPPTDQGEIQAKRLALAKVREAWGERGDG